MADRTQAYVLDKGFSSRVGGTVTTSTNAAYTTTLAGASSAGTNLSLGGSGHDVDQYSVGYEGVRKWTAGSLELYRYELTTILFPLFIHSYLDMVERGCGEKADDFFKRYSFDHTDVHAEDLRQIVGVRSPNALAESRTAQIYRGNRYSVRLCQYSHDLLVRYLMDSKYVLMLAILNQYVNIKVTSGDPVQAGDVADVANVTSSSSEPGLDKVNHQPVYWGRPDDVNIGGKDGSIVRRRPYGSANIFPSEDRVPLPSKLDSRVEITRLQAFKDSQRRATLGPKSLPSVCMYTVVNAHDTASCAHISPDGSLMSVGSTESSIKLWSLKGDKLRSFKNGPALNDVDVENGSIGDLIDENSSSISKTLIGHSGPVYATSISPDNRFLLSCSQDATVRLWSLETHSALVFYRGHNYPVWDVSFSPVGFYFCSASYDRTARLWSSDYIYPLRIFAGHMSDVDCCRFHPNCNYVATGSTDKTVRLWDVQRGDCVRLFSGHHGPVRCVAFSPDGSRVASGGDDGVVNLWDIGQGKIMQTYKGHSGTVNSLSFSEGNGSLLASGGADLTVRIWDAKGLSSTSVNGNNDAAPHTKLQLAAFATKHTPLTHLMFSRQNILLAVGPYRPQ